MEWTFNTLAKKGWRSDALWMRPAFYRSALKYLALHADTKALLRSQYWPRKKLDALTDARLEALLSAAQTVPFWENRLAALADVPEVRHRLSRLPVLRKGELVDAQRPTMDASLVRWSDADHTSGSTGIPLHFRQDWGAALRSCAMTERTFRVASHKRYPIVYVRSRPRYGFTFFRHTWFFVRGFTSIALRFDDFLALASCFRNGFTLYGYTSWILEFARRLQKIGAAIPVKSVFVAGEHIAQHDRDEMAAAFGVPEIFTLYASREVGFLGFECEKHRMHINEEWAFIEIVSDTGERVPDGEEGRIVVTTFDNRVMPFIRYDTGDRGAIDAEACPCGRTLRTLRFRGRTSERIELDGGRVVALLDIAHAIGGYRETVRQYQIVQRGPMEFLLRIVPGPQFHSNKDYIEALVVRLLHPRVRVEWELVDRIDEAESGKSVYFKRQFEEAV
jgi:phenylacetate-CoA ligase